MFSSFTFTSALVWSVLHHLQCPVVCRVLDEYELTWILIELSMFLGFHPFCSFNAILSRRRCYPRELLLAVRVTLIRILLLCFTQEDAAFVRQLRMFDTVAWKCTCDSMCFRRRIKNSKQFGFMTNEFMVELFDRERCVGAMCQESR